MIGTSIEEELFWCKEMLKEAKKIFDEYDSDGWSSQWCEDFDEGFED